MCECKDHYPYYRSVQSTSHCNCCLYAENQKLKKELEDLKKQLHQVLEDRVVMRANSNDMKAAYLKFKQEMHLAGADEY